MKKICFITGTRADYGLIKPLIEQVQKNKSLKLQLIVTGAHLSKAHGLTVNEISEKIDAKVEMLESGDNAESIVKSMGRELIALAATLTKLKPDLMIIAGDRYEMLTAASACLIMRIPIAHTYGGDVTEGAFDDAIRHAISKMSHLHFATNEDSRRRIIQLGESPKTVFNFGSPSLDKIKTLKKLSKEQLAKDLKIKFRKYNLLVTFHPETLATIPVDKQITQFISALGELSDEHSVIITMPNADPEGQKIRAALQKFSKTRSNIYLFESLGFLRYFSMLAIVDMVIGNSSSGLYETPSFKIPTVNIGNRQKGRLMAKSVINCACDKKAILSAITKAKKLDCSKVKNPYGDGNSAKKIIDIIAKTKLTTIKKFYDLHNS